MSIIQDIYKRLERAAKAFSGGTSSWDSITRGATASLSRNTSAANLMSHNTNWVYVCTDKIADTVAGISLQLRQYNKQGDDEVVIDHEAMTLLEKPNAWMTGRDFMYITVAHLELTGNAYWLKDNDGKPTQLIPVPPQNIRLITDKDGFAPMGYKITTKGGHRTVSLNEIIHLKYPNPLNGLHGAGTLEHIADWVELDRKATEWNMRFFENGSSPSVFFETEATTQEALKLSKLGYDMRFSGAENAHRAAFLPKGTKVSKDGTTPRDMEYSEADNRLRDKILSAFGVPKSVVGITEIGTSRADAEAKNYVFLAFTIEPKVKRIIATLNEVYLPAFSKTDKVYFSYEEFVPKNEEMDLRRRQVGLGNQSYLTINEVRAETGLAPIAGGDFVYGSFAAVPIGKPEQPVKAAAPVQSRRDLPSSLRKEVLKEKTVDSAIERMASKLTAKA